LKDEEKNKTYETGAWAQERTELKHDLQSGKGRETTKDEIGKATLSNWNGRENALKCKCKISIKVNVERRQGLKVITDRNMTRNGIETKLARHQRRGSGQWQSRWGIILEQGWKRGGFKGYVQSKREGKGIDITKV
jgi:hypothetical protein